jgi:3,4-dihydroxyphenylacetate 2,3-dioxygenase
MVDFNITRAAHAEFRVTDLGRAREFYVNALGMIEVEATKTALYLGGLEERDKYSIILRKAETSGASHIAFRVASGGDLERLERLFKDEGLPIRWIEANSLEGGQGRALRVQEPSGIPLEFFYEMEQRERLLQKFELYRGANLMRIDHFNCMVPNVGKTFDWWTKKLGFTLSEATVTDDGERYWAVWLHRKQNVHDVAITNGIGPRLHHVAYWAQDTASVLKACDILSSMKMGHLIERGPGRHGISNAFFLYLRDPDGNRIEIYTSDYMIPDPDFKPIIWKFSDPMRQTFWGHTAPKSWFDEAMLVEDIQTGKFMPTTEPLEKARPHYLT